MIIYLGADHGGFYLKETVKQYLQQQGKQFEDLGALQFDKDDDYPPYAKAVAKKVLASNQQGHESLGVLFCSSGSGMAIVANKLAGIRAVAIYDEKLAKHAKVDNNANIITFGGSYTPPERAIQLISLFLETAASLEPRHQRRLAQIDDVAQF